LGQFRDNVAIKIAHVEAGFMATIINRGPYQWQGKVRRKGHPAQSKTFETKSDAEAWARSIEHEMDRGVFVSRTEAENTTLRECLERYAREVSSTKRGMTQELSRIRVLLRLPIVDSSMANIRSVDIANLRDQFIRIGRSPATTMRYLALLSHLFNTARKEWGMESVANPVELVKKPKVQNARDRRLEPTEEERLLAECCNQGNHWLKPMVCFAIETAMRKGEILSLRWENVDLIKRTAFLPETKNGDSRAVPLSTKAVSVLKSLPRSVSGQIFCTSEFATRKAFIKACARANIENLRFHDLRHEATSRLAEVFGIHELAKITGHKDMKMLLRYFHPRAEDLAKKLI